MDVFFFWYILTRKTTCLQCCTHGEALAVYFQGWQSEHEVRYVTWIEESNNDPE